MRDLWDEEEDSPPPRPIYNYLGMPDREVVREKGRQDIECPRCGYKSGNDWSQCGAWCPMTDSPIYRPPSIEFAEYERNEPLADCAEFVPAIHEEYASEPNENSVFIRVHKF